jgi:hypothetical protein
VPSTHISLAALAALLIAALLIAASAPQEARARGGVELRGTTALEARFFRDLRDDHLERWSLADAFLIASGVREERDLERARRWIDALVSRAEEALRPHTSAEARADHLLRWLHREVLRRYRPSATDAVALIRSGDYNCLSSCLLYGVVGLRLGLNVRGVAVERHAFCRVYEHPTALRGRAWDVETTTAYGFNPGRDIELPQGVVSVPRSRYRDRRELELTELIGLIYTNHMGLSDAFPTLPDRALAYQKALLFFPGDARLQHNLIAVYTQHIAALLGARGGARLEEARAYLAQLDAHDGRDEYASALRVSFAEAMAEEAQRAEGAEAAARLLADPRAALGLGEAGRATPGAAAAVGLLAARYGALVARGRAASGDGEGAAEAFVGALRGVVASGERAGAARAGAALRQQLRAQEQNALAEAKNLVVDLLRSRAVELAAQLAALGARALPRDQDFQRLARAARGR